MLFVLKRSVYAIVNPQRIGTLLINARQLGNLRLLIPILKMTILIGRMTLLAWLKFPTLKNIDPKRYELIFIRDCSREADVKDWLIQRLRNGVTGLIGLIEKKDWRIRVNDLYISMGHKQVSLGPNLFFQFIFSPNSLNTFRIWDSIILDTI